MLKSLPVQLVLCLILALIGGNYFNIEVIRWAFTISCFLKEILMAILPVVIFSYLFAALLSFEKRAPVLIASILVMVIISNGLAVLTSYAVGITVLPYIISAHSVGLSGSLDIITPVFDIYFPTFITPDKAMLSGILLGIFFSFVKVQGVGKFALNLRDKVTLALHKCFVPLIPVYVFGFVIKLHHEGSLSLLLKNYGQVFALGCALIVVYISLLYLIASQFRYRVFLGYIKEMLPAGVTGFSTMSSAATIPLTLDATEVNLGNREYADLVVPTTVNIHMLGDDLVIPFIALAILLMTGHPLPDLSTYLIFTGYFCMTKFSAAAVPGGGMIVILPVVQNYLGLSAEMATLLATIYILQDSIFTASNVMGNGAFAIISQKVCRAIGVLKL